LPKNSSSGQRHRSLLRSEIEEEIRKHLSRQFGVGDIGLRFYLGGKNRVYAYKECDVEIEAAREGIYFGTIEEDGIRLSIEGSFIIGKHAKKNVIEVDEEQAKRWLKGEDLELPLSGYWIVRWGKYYLGCGKGNGKILKNFVPKNRRITNHF